MRRPLLMGKRKKSHMLSTLIKLPKEQSKGVDKMRLRRKRISPLLKRKMTIKCDIQIYIAKFYM